MSIQATDTSHSPPHTIASSVGDSSVHTPVSTPSDSPHRIAFAPTSSLRSDTKMDEKPIDDAIAPADRQEPEEPATVQAEDTTKTPSAKKKAKCIKPKHKKKKVVKKSRRKKPVRDDSDSESDDDDESTSNASDSEDSSSEEEIKKKKAKSKQLKKSKGKDKKRRKSKQLDLTSDSEDSDSQLSDSSSDDETSRRKRKKASKKARKADSDAEDDATGGESDIAKLQTDLQEIMAKMAELKANPKPSTKRRRSSTKSFSRDKKKPGKKADSLEYKRVDQLWDSNIHNYKLKESAEDEEGEFAEFAFLVRRRFDWENKYQNTVIDIKSKQLRSVLAEVMKDCKSVSLEAEEPTIDPNSLFLYLEELRTYYKKTLKSKIKSEKKRKNIKKLEQQKALCKTLVKYIDEDYAETKKTIYPLLEAGNITFDLLWALFTPNDIAITSCYGAWDEPRCFKVEYATKYQTMTRGEWYCIEGKYMEYDGKGFGYGDFEVDIESFKGPRKITSLATYPLKYHKDPDAIKKSIMERGQRFVEMEGMQYKFHKGLAFMKKKKQVLKININGRVMIDPACFRRVNANYPISLIKPKDADDLFSDDEDDDCSCCGPSSSDEDAIGGNEKLENDDASTSDKAPKFKYKWVEDEKGDPHFVAVEVDENGEPMRSQQLDKIDNAETKKRTYTQEQLLLTSPVVLGFAFSEKLWLEFSLSGIRDITYNDDAFGSLVLPDDKKMTVRALVESHKFHAAKAIDDVVQGKGRGLVFVLHGPPGTGKTLTAESISELLRCPLYIVSAGELGTDPARLESELQKILDIAHSWGALLLLDEADVFLEKREVHDIHRNALVSIFLRLLEYFQGILFLTTNRVETFGTLSELLITPLHSLTSLQMTRSSLVYMLLCATTNSHQRLARKFGARLWKEYESRMARKLLFSQKRSSPHCRVTA